jgi:hypothetical protein
MVSWKTMSAPGRGFAVGLALLALAGCAAYRQLAGTDTVSLEQAEVLRMEVDIRRAVKAICPRQPVQMWVTVDAKLPGQPAVSRLETWEGGPETRRNGKLDFTNFEFTSAQGTFDEFGFLRPVGDVLATVEGGFAIRTAFRYGAARFTETRGYPPDYSCIRSAGAAGEPGPPGRPGSEGPSSYAIHDGVDGRPGDPGRPGGPGGPGRPGPRIQAFVTYARTRFYPRLIAVRIEGDVRDLVLAVPDQVFVLQAVGGPGGPGGAGGKGGNGANGGRGRPGRNGASGGPGGPGASGGDGGDGGRGGVIEVVYDVRFPELGRLLQLDVSGGPGGPGGPGGDGGSGGDGGPGGRDGGRQGRGGPGGPAGSEGSEGSPGEQGRARLQAGAVAERFRSLPGLQPL